jgi:hypothetical protein
VRRDPTDVAERTVEVKGFRIDLIIALCALVVSSLATAAAVWQSHVVAQQLSSQVWPYVAFQTTYEKNAVTETRGCCHPELVEGEPRRAFVVTELGEVTTIVPGFTVDARRAPSHFAELSTTGGAA